MTDHRTPRDDDLPRPPGRGARSFPATLHEQAELIAIPDYDWVGGPVGAVSDGIINFARRHSHHAAPEPRTAAPEPAPPADPRHRPAAGPSSPDRPG
ncbi:hypothetical protein [Plantactinospora sp. KBS50]|uniref:hypothetical protein n=1 Tax=Plantactinospora sp. KBS50 TaxID=2024580 RepID=UPI000BAACC9E|nr:hypothetical protein [Plantactinospora sp. KBS50]ASW55192.1 hypothetical protein CIK06_14940 [Plantactinospora sp. KBS50]